MKKILILILPLLLACGGGSGSSSPVAPGGDDQTPNDETPVNSPVEGNWSVTELAIIDAGDTMSVSNPNTTGTAVFTGTDADVEVSLFGQPTIDESGPYTFNTATALLSIQTDRGDRNWTYTVSGDILRLEGVRSSGGEQLYIIVTAGR